MDLVARQQVQLGTRRCLQLALAGLWFRLFRSLITVAILGLAVAFLVHMLAYSVVSGVTERSIWQVLETERARAALLRRLEHPDPLVLILNSLSQDRPERLAEYRSWSGLSESEWAAVLNNASTLASIESTLKRMPGRDRAVLIGDRNTFQLLDSLEQATARDAFFERAQPLRVILPLGGEEPWTEWIVEEWPLLKQAAERIQRGHRDAIRSFRDTLHASPLAEALDLDPAAVADAAKTAAFSVSHYNFEDLAVFVREQSDRRLLEDALNVPAIRRAVARELTMSPADITPAHFLEWIAASQANATVFEDVLRRYPGERTLDAARIHDVARGALHFQRLQDLVPRPPDPGTGWFGLTAGTQWLVALALLVCVIGVANAMLMSVTERFTEIATMKCLGALDRSVLWMFVFEAALQGLVGGLLGALLGSALAVFRGWWEYGNAVVLQGQWSLITLAALSSLLIGILLSMLAAVGPSWVAARLAPMEAMRVD